MQKPTNSSKSTSSKDKDPLIDKINDFGNILQSFGLNLIQTIGEMKHTLGVLVDKVDSIEKELINLKGVSTSFQNLDKFRRDVDGDFSEIKAQLNNLIGKIPSEGFKASPTCSDENVAELNTPIEVLDLFETQIQGCASTNDLRTFLNCAKERLFVLTGGHKILFELREYERKIHSLPVLTDEIKEEMVAKIQEWKAQI